MIRIVVGVDWFAERMGYSENLLPKALAKLGAEVHVVTSDLQPDFPDYAEVYEPFIGPRLQPTGLKQMDGFTLHRLPHGSQRHGIYIRNFHQTLTQIRPHIVQCFTLPSFCTYQAALSKLVLGYKLFLEEHIHLSVFNPPKTWKRRIFFTIYKLFVGNLLSILSERCYPIAPDVADIAVNYYGYSPRKIQICSLGVDTDVFVPIVTETQQQRRNALRTKLGFDKGDIVCVYSGRFTQGKDPLCLARAIDQLQQDDHRFKALFIGQGTSAYVEAMRMCKGVVICPFVEYTRLPEFYQVADIGVWPRQESTSQLDAAGCGLPLILSNRIEVRERVHGNGLLYEEGDSSDLARQIRTLANPATRQRLGEAGVNKIREHFSWDQIAKQRIQDYQEVLGH